MAHADFGKTPHPRLYLPTTSPHPPEGEERDSSINQKNREEAIPTQMGQ